jgi:chemotaxis protein methyltransferase CheR
MALKRGGRRPCDLPALLCPENDQASDFDTFAVPSPMPITQATSWLIKFGFEQFASMSVGDTDRMLQDGKDLSENSSLAAGNEALFFQEMHHFNFLAETVVSDLKAGASLGRKQHVRIWSAACSTGEEPYSIAIALLEAFRDAPESEPPIYQPQGWHIEVVASDIELTTAMDRVYSEQALSGLSPEVQKRYFLRGKGDKTGRVRVKQELAELVHFQHLNLLESDWAIEGRFDVIFFRNALTYFDPEAQEQILRKMLHHLEPHSYLILGQSERVPSLRGAVLPIGNGIHQSRPRGMVRYIGTERRTHPRSIVHPKSEALQDSAEQDSWEP